MQPPACAVVYSGSDLIGFGLAAVLAKAGLHVQVVRPDIDPGLRRAGDVAVIDATELAVPVGHLLERVRSVPEALVVAVTSPRPPQAVLAQVAHFRHTPVSTSGVQLVRLVEDIAHRRIPTHGPSTWSEAARPGSVASLTARELDVLRGLCTGKSNSEIAAQLFLGVNTVKTYIRTAYRKIGATTRAQALIWALENGLGPAGQPHATTRRVGR